MTSSGQDLSIPNDAPRPAHEVADASTSSDGPSPEHRAPDAPTVEHHAADVPTPNDTPTIENLVTDASSQAAASNLDAAYVIMRALHGDRIPEGALSPETVPSAVLDLPVAVVIEDLVYHAKHCQRLQCPHVPQPLRVYRRMRPDAIRNAKEQVYKVLWTHPNAELITSVRKQILKDHHKLADEISTGRLLVGKRLAETLNENDPRVLAAVLWALEFKGPGADSLFRMLVPLAAGEGPKLSETGGVASDDHRRRSLKAKRESTKDFTRVKRAADQVRKELQLKTQELETTKTELEGAQRKYHELTKKLETTESRLKDTDAAYRILEHDAGKAARVNDNLRRDIRQLQDAQRELEVGRSDLARQLAADRREIEHLKLGIAAVPRGPDAVMEFLRTEEERIQTERTISSGGTRKRADEEWLVYRKLKNAFLDFRPQYRQPPPVRIRPKTQLQMLALGGSAEIGRSCYLLELGKHRILVDCGIKPSGYEDLYPEIERLEHLNALILTHAHTDHIGWVPALTRRFPELDIYCSEGTAALLPVMLDDCYQHYMRKMWVQRDRAKYIVNAAVAEEKYDADDVFGVPNLVIKCTFNEEEQLPFGDVSIRFYRAGHILGAASVLIQDQSGRRIFFSGDFSSFPQLTVQAANWPEDLGEVDLLVLESTYGNRVHKPFDERRGELISFVRKTIEGQGSVILASFGLGRAQELLKLISDAQKSGELPAVPVYVDGMIKRINPIYQRLGDLQLSFGNIYEVSGEADRQDVATAAQTKPSIIVTTSGMFTGGPVLHYARLLLPDRRHRIVLTGYQDEGAPSRDLRGLIEGPRRVAFPDERGEIVEFDAAMPAKEVSFSSHADQPGLVEYAGRLRPKNIALVHGDPAAQEVLRQHLLRLHPKADIISGPSEFRVP